MIEYHQIISSGRESIINLFSVHQDNVNAVCNTVIYYVEVADTIDKGNLVICNSDNEHDVVEVEVVDVKSPDKDKIKVVVMSGNTWHYIQPTEGFGVRACGVRACVVVQCAI